LNRIRSILFILAHHPDPKQEDDQKSDFDPFTHSLNCIRGVAMHGIIQYSLYLVRQREKVGLKDQEKGFLEPEIQEILEEKLDQSNESSLAVHSIFGAYIPQLHFLNSVWLQKNLSAILPEKEEKSAYWKAAWDSYLFASGPYRDVVNLLIPQYQRGIKLLSQPQDGPKFLGGDPIEHLAQHVMFAYLVCITDFEHENVLLDLFFSNAPVAIRANGIFWISQVLNQEKPPVDSQIWQRCFALWQHRLKAAESQDPSEHAQEISDYLRWLDNCPVGLEVLYPMLKQTTHYLFDGFDIQQITDYAAKYAEDYPLEAVTLLWECIKSAKETWWTPDEKSEETILKVALESGNSLAKQIALDVINFRGENGDFRWRKFVA
jgi:hypothetical protein